MKVVSPDINLPLVEENTLINETIIESEEYFSTIVFDLYEQLAGKSGQIIISEEGTLCSIKTVTLVAEPLDVDINSRTTLNRLYKHIETKANVEQLPEPYYHALRNLYDTITHLWDNFFLEPSHVEDVSLSQVLSLFQMRFPDDSLNFGERIIDFMEVHRELFGIKLFIFVQIRAFLPPDVFESLLSSIRYGKFQVWFIESSERKQPLNTDHYRRLIIDRDGCEI
jgi:CRISPR type II-A-associated protein Csn2